MNSSTFVDVLVPTFRRKTALAMLLTSLLGQTHRTFRVTIADQTPLDERYLDDRELRTIVAALRWHGVPVRAFARVERRGIAEQRAFLLDCADAPFVHYLDDDVVLAPDTLERMLATIEGEGCGFVGAAAAAFDFLRDERPDDWREFEPWSEPVIPERVEPDEPAWQRHRVNRAATPLHLERRLVRDGTTLRYHVAWVGGANVLYDRAKLHAVGGFDFWPRLPPAHAGEDTLVQLLLLERFGGCAILPCGTYHQRLPTTLRNRSVDALTLRASVRRHAG